MAEVRYYENTSQLTKDSLNNNFEAIFSVLNECYTKIEELNNIDTKLKEAEDKIEEINSKLSSNNTWINSINDKIKPFEERYLIINSNYQDSFGKFKLIKNNFDSINDKYNKLKIKDLEDTFNQFNTDYSKLLEENNSFIESYLTVNELSTLRSSELDDINTHINTITNIGTNLINRKGIRTTNKFITGEGDTGLFGKISGFDTKFNGLNDNFDTKFGGLSKDIGGKISGLDSKFGGLNDVITGEGENGLFGKIKGLNDVITGNTGFGGISSTLTTMGNNITGITNSITGNGGLKGAINFVGDLISGETKNNSLFNKFKDITDKVTGLTTAVTDTTNGVFGKISGIKNTVNTISGHTSNISGIKNTVNTISGQTSGLTGNFDEVSTNLGSILSGVTIVNTNIKKANSNNTGLTGFNGVLLKNGSTINTVPNSFIGNNWGDFEYYEPVS